MPVIKCKMCGGDLNIVEDSTVCECEYCGTKQTVPKVDDEKKLKLFSRAGKLLRACEFDKASGVFESIIADFPEEAEAYWGLILCKYGIEYVDDPATGKKVPTCHRSSFESVEDDSNFEQACENADTIARRVYRDEARQIETLRKRILEVSGKEEPYDVFISYKELDEDGDRTPESVIAQDIYRALTKEGYRVFFSRISLEGKLGVEYEPYIFAALNSAKVMIVVGTDYEYFDAVWVKNEWSRFLKLIASGQQKTVIPVYKDMDPYDMPKELRALAAQNMGKIGAMQDLLHGVEKLLGKTNEQTPKEQPVIVQSGGPNVTALLDRGNMALEDEEWDKARELFDQVLNMDSRNADAYMGLAMSEEKCRDHEELHRAYIEPTSKCKSNKRLLRARQFGNEKLRTWFSIIDNERQIKEQELELVVVLNLIKNKQEKLEAAKRLKTLRKKQKKASVMIAAGTDHIVGVRSDGTVVAVGSNNSGQCDVSGWTDIMAIAAGDSYTVGLKVDGTVVAAGSNNSGQCDVSGWRDIVSVAAGGSHTLGLKADGTVVAVGSNNYGQCDISGWKDIVAVATGDNHAVGLKADGTVIATQYTGNINYGQYNVSGWTDIVAVAAGWDYTVGLRSDGTVIAAGYTCKVNDWTDIGAIAAGINHTVGLRSDGTVVAVGNNYSGKCAVSGWTDVVAVAAGDTHTVGLKGDGTVVAVGYNNDGRCEVSGWKLFENYETIEEERKASAEKAEAERKAAAKKAEADRKAAAEKAEAERKIAEIERKAAQAKLKESISSLEKEGAELKEELENLHGFFSGKRRKEINERLLKITSEIGRMEWKLKNVEYELNSR